MYVNATLFNFFLSLRSVSPTKLLHVLCLLASQTRLPREKLRHVSGLGLPGEHFPLTTILLKDSHELEYAFHSYEQLVELSHDIWFFLPFDVTPVSAEEVLQAVGSGIDLFDSMYPWKSFLHSWL